MDSVYFMQAEGRIKIGRSTDVLQRLNQLKTAHPGIVLLAAFEGIGKFERRVHEAVSSDRVAGEWFNASPAVMRLAGAASSEELLELIGKVAHVPARRADTTEKDRADLVAAARLVKEGKALRARVLARIRQRKHRRTNDVEGRRQGGLGKDDPQRSPGTG